MKILLKNSFKYASLIWVLFLVLLSNFSKAQSALQQELNISFKNQNLVSCIKAISDQSQINFTYDPAILPNIHISKVYNNQTVNAVLYSLLNKHDIAYDELSGQIILYKAPENLKSKSIQMNLNESKKNDTDLIIKPMQKPDDIKESFMEIEEENIRVDTFYVHTTDTLYITDTIIKIKTDSILVRDTVFIKDSISIFDQMFAVTGTNKYSPWLSASLIATVQPKLFGDYDLQNQDGYSENNAIELSIKNGYSVLAVLHVNANKFNAKIGVGFGSVLQEFNATQLSHGGYFINDTIEQYYTEVTGNDTSWHYVLKEKYVETEEFRTKTSYVNQNFVQIPLSMGYSLHYKKFLIEFNVGFMASFSLTPRVNNIYTYNSDDVVIDTVAFETRNTNYSVCASVAFNYLLNNNLSVGIQPYYCKNLESIYTDKSPYSAMLWYPGVYIGFRYFFKRKTEE